jgi:hypothetical protein
MPTEPAEPEGDLPPPGRRWGTGAQSVLPYLTRTLQAKPLTGASDPREFQAPVNAPSSEQRHSANS